MTKKHLKALRKLADRTAASISKRCYVFVASPLSILLMRHARLVDSIVEKVVGAVEEVNTTGQRTAVSQRDGRLSILALSSEKFRHDLEVLATQPELRVLWMSTDWQRRMLRWFHGVWPSERDVHNPPPRSGAARAKLAYQRFLREFLPRFYRRLGVDVIVGANVRYKEDVDWGIVSQGLGVPYVVFHRENLPKGDKGRIVKRIVNRYVGFGPFRGECISVHNTSARDYFEKANYCERIHVLGCLRMDPFLQRLQRPRVVRARPLIVLFSFRSDSPSYFGASGYYPPFRDSHGALALLAKEHPELDVLIKPKPETFRNRTWNLELPQAFRDWGVDPNRLPPNLRIDPVSDAQDLIVSASVVVALNSTTLVEAAIAGLPVIMPNFRYLREGPHAADVFLREYSDLFDVPDTGEDLMQIVLHRLRDPWIPDDIMRRRRVLFADAVSSLEGNAIEGYVQLLKRVVSDQQQACGQAALAETAAKEDDGSAALSD